MNRLLDAYDYVRDYRRQYVNQCMNKFIGGTVPWRDYLKSKRIYKGETKKDFMRRIAERYHADLRNDQLLQYLDRIERSLLRMIDILSKGIPLPKQLVVPQLRAIQSLPSNPEILPESIPIPPPPPPLPIQLIRKEKSIIQEQEIKPQREAIRPPSQTELLSMLARLKKPTERGKVEKTLTPIEKEILKRRRSIEPEEREIPKKSSSIILFS
jgi:hypothetical protein